MASNKQRREAYNFYRSLGYSSKEAAKMRNRGRERVSNDYRTAARKFNNQRIIAYRKDEDITKPKYSKKAPKPYRPELLINENERGIYRRSLHEFYDVPGHIVDEMLSGDNYLNVEIYSERIRKLQGFFEGTGRDWDELMQDLMAEYYDLGDFFDILGEYYDEDKGV